MNNKRILIVGVLAVIVTLMVGYALFSETITINGTATAKGDFSLTTTCQAGVTDEYNTAFETLFGYDTISIENGYSNSDTCTVTGNTVTMSTSLNYPGAARLFTVSVKNTGTIDAIIDVSDSAEKLQPNNTLKAYNSKTNELIETANEHYSILSYQETYGLMIKKENGSFITSNEEYTNNSSLLEDSEGNIYVKIAPNETLVVLYRAYWNKSFDDKDFDLNWDEYYLVAEASAQLNFIQIKPNMTVSTDDFYCIAGC